MHRFKAAVFAAGALAVATLSLPAPVRAGTPFVARGVVGIDRHYSFFDVFTEIDLPPTYMGPPPPGQFHIDSFFDVFVDLDPPAGPPVDSFFDVFTELNMAPGGGTGGTPPGGFHIDSFFDVFTEISLDGVKSPPPTPGDARIGSFFDIFTEISLDAGTGRGDLRWDGGTSFETQDGKIELHAVGDSDPMVGYGLAVTDYGAPSTFMFAFGIPIVPTGPFTTVSSGIGGALLDMGGDGVGLIPTGADVQTNMVGLPLTNTGVDIGGPALFPGMGGPMVHLYGTFTEGPQAGPTGTWGFLGTGASFMLSGGEDIAVLTGATTVDAAMTPEPGTFALLGLGAVGLLRRRRARRG